MAFPTYPGEWQNALVYLPDFSLYPERFKQTAGGSACAIGDPVGEIETGIAGVVLDSPNSPDRRPVIASDGSVQFGNTSTTYLRLNDGAYTKILHAAGEVYVMISLCCNDDMGTGVGRTLIDSTNLSTTNLGIRIGIDVADSIIFRLNNGNASSPIINLTTADTIPDDNAYHVYKGRCTVGYGTGRIDRGAKAYGARGSLGANSNAGALYIGNRQTQDRVFLGRIKSIWIGTGPPTAEQEAWWDAQYPAGSITGDPELIAGQFHTNMTKSRAYNPTRFWFANKDMYSAAAIDGTVFDDKGADDSPDGTSWRGGPHGREVISDVFAWVDGVPVAWADGAVLEGGTVKVARHSMIGDSFNSLQTLTLSGNRRLDEVLAVRQNDGFAINPHYIFRLGRTLSFSSYITLDADGEILADSTTTAANGLNVVVGDNTARAVAQFSSSLGVMVLTTLTKGYGVDEEWIIVDDTTNKRLYVELTTSRRSPAAGVVLDMSLLSTFYETDSGSWKALAQSELVRLLNPARQSVPMLSLGLRLGV